MIRFKNQLTLIIALTFTASWFTGLSYAQEAATIEPAATTATDDLLPEVLDDSDETSDKIESDKQKPDANKKEREDYYKLLMIFADTIDQIDRNYVEKVSRRELLEAAIEGALKKLDPYSNYIAPEEMDEFKVEVENEFGGIGIQISSQNDQIQVISPLVGTPAYRAGIQAGDMILEIDGTPTKGMRISDAIKLMKGYAGTDLNLKVLHAIEGTREDIKLTREVIKVQTVLGDRRKADDAWQYMLDETSKIAYVRITTFGRETAQDLLEVLSALKQSGMRGLILDLRYNPGGLLKSAIEVSDAFLESGTIVSTEGRNIKRQVWDAEKPNTYKDFPMVVMVNQFSASASEIVAAALQDHKRATVIGQQTFGKASVQNVVELEDGKSALKITTGSYQRPSGKPIHRFPEATEWGVKPNEGLEIELSNLEIRRLMDQRRRRDIVRGEAPATYYEDRQLDRALEFLRIEISKSSNNPG